MELVQRELAHESVGEHGTATMWELGDGSVPMFWMVVCNLYLGDQTLERVRHFTTLQEAQEDYDGGIDAIKRGEVR